MLMDKFLFIMFFITYLILNVMENYFRDEEKFNYLINSQIAKKYQRKWKSFQFMQWLIVFMIFLYYLNFQWHKKLIALALIGILWTYIYDGLLNILKNREFFYVSMQTESLIEKNISKYIRANPIISLLIMIISILLFITIIIGG